LEAAEKGWLCGSPIIGVRFVLQDGAYHDVDSSELAFRIASINAFREAYKLSKPVILEPIMSVEVTAPIEFQSTFVFAVSNIVFTTILDTVIGGLNQRRGTIIDTDVREDDFTCIADVALNDMFGYSNQLRGGTQGKGEFSMEYKVRLVLLVFVSLFVF
jgi:elongation factor G